MEIVCDFVIFSVCLLALHKKTDYLSYIASRRMNASILYEIQR